MPIRVGVELAPVKGHAGASRRVEVFCGAGEQVLRWISFAALTRMAYELGDTPGVRRAPSAPPPTVGPPARPEPSAARRRCHARRPCAARVAARLRPRLPWSGLPGPEISAPRLLQAALGVPTSCCGGWGGAPRSPDPTAVLSAARRGPSKD